MQFAGVWMAVATFLGIWWGHVGVRWLEARSSRVEPPAVLLILAGLGLNIFALFSASLTVAGVSSIIGITLLWDAFELFRQQKRVLKGHAPANPNNPRHAAYLAQGGAATTTDLLDREPAGRPVGKTSRLAHGVDRAMASSD
jgi:divalent metal cation (Fe/Co/Zn/Cd) transporter